MKFLLEGPDCTGKSTLCKYLSTIFPGHYIHNSNIKDDFEYEKHTANVFNIINFTTSGDNIFVDRLLPSEFVYGNVYRGKSRKTLEETLNSFSCFDKVIFCLPKDKNKYLDLFKKVSNTREEYITDINKISEIYDSYDMLLTEAYKKYQNISENIIRYDLFDFLNND